MVMIGITGRRTGGDDATGGDFRCFLRLVSLRFPHPPPCSALVATPFLPSRYLPEMVLKTRGLMVIKMIAL